MNDTKTRRVLFVYYSYSQQTLRIVETMCDVFRARGAAVGAMMRGIPVVDGQYAGSLLGWLHPFAILTGIGLVLGYALLGAGWLVLKSESELRDWAYRRLPWLVAGVLIVLGSRSQSRSTTASSREAICRRCLGVSRPP